MAKNDFKAFATDRNANVMSQEEWEALPALISGFTAGKASSAQVNKVIRQASFIAAALAQFVSDKTQRDVLDNGDLPGFVELLGSGFAVEYLSRKNPFGDIKSDGTVKTALENLGLGEAAKMSAAALVINGNTLTAKIPVVINGVNMEFIIQASQISSSASNGVITFPSAFPNACIAIFAHDFATVSTDLSNVRFYMPGRTSASWTGQNMSTGSESSPATWCWLAIGW